MHVYYKGCLCTYGTYRVQGEELPVLFLNESPPGENLFEKGFEEIHYGLWCHFLSEEEHNKYFTGNNNSKETIDEF